MPCRSLLICCFCLMLSLASGTSLWSGCSNFCCVLHCMLDSISLYFSIRWEFRRSIRPWRTFWWYSDFQRRINCPSVTKEKRNFTLAQMECRGSSTININYTNWRKMKLHYSLSYHPEFNRRTTNINNTIHEVENEKRKCRDHKETQKLTLGVGYRRHEVRYLTRIVKTSRYHIWDNTWLNYVISQRDC